MAPPTLFGNVHTSSVHLSLRLCVFLLFLFRSNTHILIGAQRVLAAGAAASANGNGAHAFKACPPSSHHLTEKRKLYVATCDSRDGWKEFMALKTWNVTGYNLRTGTVAGTTLTSSTGSKRVAVTSAPLSMTNVCKAHAWGGFLTKPLLYLEWLLTIPPKNEQGGDNHVILMDSDTFWAANDLTSIWNKYDCARGGKDLLLSTEMSCWVGRYCTQEDMHRYYNHTPSTPSFSPFLNSGVVMGKVNNVRHMLEYVIAHNESYYITYFKRKFDDQYAYTDYAFVVKGLNEVAVDYHQQLLASFSIHAPGDPYEDGWPFSCRTRNEDERWGHHICPSCPNWTPLLSKQGYFHMNNDDCTIQRKTWKGMPLQTELESLAPTPVIWHGNGVGKKAYYHFAHQAYACGLAKRNITETQYTTGPEYCC